MFSLVIDRTKREKIIRAETLSRGCIIFSSAKKRFSKINPILEHKTCFNKLKRIEIIQCIFSEHKGIKLGINNRKIYRSTSRYSKMNNYLSKYSCLINT